MIKKWLSKSKAQNPLDAARLPEGMRVYAIGDVHGCNDHLKNLLTQILEDNDARGKADTQVIFLGDLVDRGPDSAAVLDTTIEFQKYFGAVRCLKGNHEEVFLAALAGSEKATRFFTRIGGKETILSYEISRKDFNALSMEELAQTLPRIVPRNHVDFLNSFEDQIILGDYAFVHAGIRPEIPLSEQKISDMRWIREEFLRHQQPHEKVIIYGHTIYDDVEEKRNRIGIDTGAYNSGKLTAIGLEAGERWYLDTQ